MGNSIYCSLIYFWVPSSCFCIVDQPLSEGEIIPFSGVCQSGGGCIIHAGGELVASHTDDRLLWCATDDDQRQHHHTEHHFQHQHPANSFRVFCIRRSNITLTHICMSVIAAFASFSSLAFVALGFVGNGVITVMINSPWQADDDADNQSGNNRGDSAPYINLSDRSARFFEFCNQAVSLMLRTDHNQRPAVKPRYLLQRSIAWRISPRSIIGKAPRSLICCNATASWLFGEKSFRPSFLQ